MINALAISLNIKRFGRIFTFYRHVKNEYGGNDPTKDDTVVFGQLGLFHETSSYLPVSAGNNSIVKSKAVPQILMLYSLESEDLKTDDFITHNNKTFKVTEVANLGEQNLVLDISLEEVV